MSLLNHFTDKPRGRRASIFTTLALILILFSASKIAQADEATVAVTGQVSAHPSDFLTKLELLGDKDNFAQDSILEYRVTYGSQLKQSTKLTVEVSWELGRLESETSPTVDFLEYVIGSATLADNNTAAVVDSAHRQISWTIASFPKSTNQKTVRFKLRTKATYAGKKRVQFTVAARTASPESTSPFSKISRNFVYQPLSELTGTQPSFFQDVTVYQVASTSATVSVTTKFPSKVTLRYGEAAETLGKVIVSPNYVTEHRLVLSGLKEKVVYFFEVTAKDMDKETNVSDIYTFRTAEASTAPQIRIETMIITSGNKLLYDESQSEGLGALPSLIIPKDLDYELKFSMARPTTVRTAAISIRNKKVLGISTALAEGEANTGSADLVEVRPGQFYGKLKSPSTPGLFDVIVQIFDRQGNIVTEKLADLYVTEYLTVKSVENKTAIEGAQVTFYYYNPKLRLYEFLPSQIFPIKNPDYTNARGEILSALPLGRYKAAVTAIGFNGAESEFSLGPSEAQTYPEIALSPQPFSLKTPIVYYGTILADSLHITRLYIETLSQSLRFFHLITVASFASLLLLTLLSFSLKTHIPLSHLPRYLFFHLRRLMPRSSPATHIQGRVRDAHTLSAISRANVYLMDAEKHLVVGETSTNKAGEFFSDNLGGGHYAIQVIKKGYEPSVAPEYPRGG